jgi:hypothetical protein
MYLMFSYSTERQKIVIRPSIAEVEELIKAHITHRVAIGEPEIHCAASP